MDTGLLWNWFTSFVQHKPAVCDVIGDLGHRRCLWVSCWCVTFCAYHFVVSYRHLVDDEVFFHEYRLYHVKCVSFLYAWWAGVRQPSTKPELLFSCNAKEWNGRGTMVDDDVIQHRATSFLLQNFIFCLSLSFIFCWRNPFVSCFWLPWCLWCLLFLPYM